MKIILNLHTTLRNTIGPGERYPLSTRIYPNWSVKKLLQKIGLNYDRETLIIIINSQVKDIDTILKDGDVLDVVPAISGG